MPYKLIAQILYRNNCSRQAVSFDEEISFLSICTEELKSVVGDRDKMPSTDDLIRILLFIDTCGFGYFNMYIKRKYVNGFETIYTFGYLDKGNEFSIHIEHEQCFDRNGNPADVAHIGILMDFT